MRQIDDFITLLTIELKRRSVWTTNELQEVIQTTKAKIIVGQTVNMLTEHKQ